MPIMLILTLLLISLLPAVLADPPANNSSNYSTSRVNVHIPFNIHQVHGYPHVQANFGFQHRSGSISEYVYAFYQNENLCSPVSFNHTSAAVPNHTEGLKPPFILMVKSGVCSAVTKARYAQQLGAAALVIADPHCQCGDTNCTAAFPNDTCIDHDPILVDDGSGADVSIPTFLIFKGLAHSLHQTLMANQPVLMDLKWGLHPEYGADSNDLPLYVSLWTSAHDPYLDLEVCTYP